MSQEGLLNIESSDTLKVKVTMWLGHTRAKEHSIWLLYLLKHPGFLERCLYKQNIHGRVKVTYVLRKLDNWERLLNDTRDSVLSLITKNENLNTG